MAAPRQFGSDVPVTAADLEQIRAFVQMQSNEVRGFARRNVDRAVHHRINGEARAERQRRR